MSAKKRPRSRTDYPAFEPDTAQEEKPGPLPLEPTKELPGTPEKIEVLKERACRREQLFHDDDANFDQPKKKKPAEPEEADCRTANEFFDLGSMMQVA